MSRIYTVAQHISAALTRRAGAIESVMGGAAGRAATGVALRGGRSGVRSARKSVAVARSTIATTLGRHDKLMSTGFGRIRSSVGGQAAMGIGAGLGVIGTNLFASEFSEKFGDQLSGADKFMVGAIKVGATIGGGLTAVTHLGRAGLMAKAQFSSKSVAGTKIAGSLRAAKSSAERVQQSTTLENLSTMEARLAARGQWNRGAGGQYISGGTQTLARSRGNRLAGQRNPAAHWIHNVNRRTNAPFRSGESGILMERRRRQATTISNRAKTLQKQAAEVRKSGISVEKSLLRNRAKIDRVSIWEEATKFSTRKIAMGLGKAPFMLGGAMLGRGAFWGKIEPGMQFTGKALGGGLIGGLVAGGVVGITAVKQGNLGRTAGPAQRQGGRSFANINYNATLHSHRRNH